MRQVSSISPVEYQDFYKLFAKETTESLSWTHFKTEGEVEFRSLIYIPKEGPSGYLERSVDNHRIKLYVRRVFITDELIDFLPRYLSFVTGVVDSDDMPLNVSRETLAQHALLKVIKKKVIAKILDLIKRMSLKDPKKYDLFIKEYNTALKFGILEDKDNMKRLSNLIRVETSHSDKLTSLDDYVKRMKVGQPQIYYVTGLSLPELKASPFVEVLIKRGYEVIYFTTPVDEYVVQALSSYGGKKLQSAAKSGLEFGDEDDTGKEELKANQEKFKPLSDWMVKTLGSNQSILPPFFTILINIGSQVSSVVVSNRLLTSACTVVSGVYGQSGLMEKMMRSSNAKDARINSAPAKVFEINPVKRIIFDTLY